MFILNGNDTLKLSEILSKCKRVNRTTLNLIRVNCDLIENERKTTQKRVKPHKKMKTTRKRVTISPKKSDIYYHSKVCCPAFNSFSSGTHSFSSATHVFFRVKPTLFWVKIILSLDIERISAIYWVVSTGVSTRKKVKRRTTHFRVVVKFRSFSENCHSFSSGYQSILICFTLFWVVFHSFSSESWFTRFYI